MEVTVKKLRKPAIVFKIALSGISHQFLISIPLTWFNGFHLRSFLHKVQQRMSHVSSVINKVWLVLECLQFNKCKPLNSTMSCQCFKAAQHISLSPICGTPANDNLETGLWWVMGERGYVDWHSVEFLSFWSRYNNFQSFSRTPEAFSRTLSYDSNV